MECFLVNGYKSITISQHEKIKMQLDLVNLKRKLINLYYHSSFGKLLHPSTHLYVLKISWVTIQLKNQGILEGHYLGQDEMPKPHVLAAPVTDKSQCA